MIQAPITAQGPNGPINAWILDRWIEDPSGHRVGIGQVMQQMGLANSHAKVTPAIVDSWVTPAPLHTVGSGALVVAAAVVRWLRRRAV